MFCKQRFNLPAIIGLLFWSDSRSYYIIGKYVKHRYERKWSTNEPKRRQWGFYYNMTGNSWINWLVEYNGCKHMKIMCVHCGWRNEYRIDLRSYEHYWTSSWNKAWKKFRRVRDLNPWPRRHRCNVLPTELTCQLELCLMQINIQNGE